jgi:hypothetical protein
MPTISKPQVGAVAFGRSGLGYIIEALEADRILLRTPSGLKRVPLGAVIRCELPPDSATPAIRKGCRVGKARNLGWWGVAQSDPANGWVEVLWDYDRYPTLERVSDLKWRMEK